MRVPRVAYEGHRLLALTYHRARADHSGQARRASQASSTAQQRVGRACWCGLHAVYVGNAWLARTHPSSSPCGALLPGTT
jgi:hypothetical protein